MDIVVNPNKQELEQRLARAYSSDGDIRNRVERIVEEVRTKGDAALYEFIRNFNGIELSTLEVSPEEFAAAEAQVSDELKSAISIAYKNIESFHRAQLPKTIEVETMTGVRCVQKAVGIRSVGLYVPGGSAPLFSTVLMLAIPAKVAGCKEVCICTPPRNDGSISPEILYTAKVCGVGKVFKAGGAQAIAAMSYRTESIPKVDKIFGPGNQYVTAAKQLLSTRTAIDMPAGPSEVMVLADDTANPTFVAADLLSQAEHGADSQAILVTNSQQIAEQTAQQLGLLTEQLERKDIIRKALKNGCIIVVDSRERMVEIADAYAPEHLIVAMDKAWEIADKVTAGSIFIGNYSPESAGDYASGTNHTLPTAGWARSYSGLNIDSFMRKTTYQELTQEGLNRLGATIMNMAQAEGLDAHKLAVEVRLKTSSQTTNQISTPSTANATRDLVRENIASLTPYSTARDEYKGDIGIYLDANENPYNNGYNRYPDPHQLKLKQVLSKVKNIATENIFIGNGSDEAIDLAYRIFCEPRVDNVVSISPTYGMYKVAAEINNVEFREVPLTKDFMPDCDALLSATDTNTKLLFLCSPNNPTGNSLPKEQIERLIREFRGMVVLDEAYADFASDESFLKRLDSFPNLIILQTLSKAWGMAGLRLGLAFASTEVIQHFSRVKYPYNINGITQELVMQRLQQPITKQVDEIVKQREILLSELPKCPSVITVYPSDANFILVQVTDARGLYEKLIAEGLIVRDRSHIAGCEACLRITVGTPKENEKLLQILRKG